MQTFYIRQPDEEEGRGPYNQDQLETLAVAGQIDSDTLYYVEHDESWLPLTEHTQLAPKLFPKKMKMQMRSRQAIASPDGKGTVDDDFSRLLKEDKVQSDRAENDAIKAILFTDLRFWHLAAALLSALGAVTLLRPHFGELTGLFSNFSMIWKQPAIAIGMLDVLVALFLLLGATSFSNYLRIRFTILAGIALLFWWVGYEFNHSIATFIAWGGILLFTSTRWALTQGIGLAISAVALIIVILRGGYLFQ